MAKSKYVFTKLRVMPGMAEGAVVVELKGIRTELSKQAALDLMSFIGYAINERKFNEMDVNLESTNRFTGDITPEKAQEVWKEYERFNRKKHHGAVSETAIAMNVPYHKVRTIVAAFQAELSRMYHKGMNLNTDDIRPPEFYGAAEVK